MNISEKNRLEAELLANEQQLQSYASTHGIQMKTVLNVPAGMKCDSMDLVILLGNILDNAVEACKISVQL